MFEKIVVITKKTPLEELIERFNTKAQAKFYIEHSGSSFQEYENYHEVYHQSLDALRLSLPLTVKHQFIERTFLPTFTFGSNDLVITLGPDGLVINTARYLNGQPIFAVNPDKSRIDGVLIPFTIDITAKEVNRVLNNNYETFKITMIKAKLNDGQEIYAVNDIFVGAKSHVSARYNINFKNQNENQSSSGIIISTGMGSTGWLRSIVTGAVNITKSYNLVLKEVLLKIQEANNMDSKFNWDANHLYFVVREPFPSKTSKTSIILGKITKEEPLTVTSSMPENGVIFSDGIESDFLEFNSGRIASITIADKTTRLIKN